jgi:hypothetical protein
LTNARKANRGFTGKPENRKTGKPENRKTGKPENRKTGKPENRKTGKPDNSSDGNMSDPRNGPKDFISRLRKTAQASAPIPYSASVWYFPGRRICPLQSSEGAVKSRLSARW